MSSLVFEQQLRLMSYLEFAVRAHPYRQHILSFHDLFIKISFKVTHILPCRPIISYLSSFKFFSLVSLSVVSQRKVCSTSSCSLVLCLKCHHSEKLGLDSRPSSINIRFMRKRTTHIANKNEPYCK